MHLHGQKSKQEGLHPQTCCDCGFKPSSNMQSAKTSVAVFTCTTATAGCEPPHSDVGFLNHLELQLQQQMMVFYVVTTANNCTALKSAFASTSSCVLYQCIIVLLYSQVVFCKIEWKKKSLIPVNPEEQEVEEDVLIDNVPVSVNAADSHHETPRSDSPDALVTSRIANESDEYTSSVINAVMVS